MSTAYIDLLKATRAEIVNLLKRRGGLSAENLASELHISRVAVRRHLEQLELRGLVSHIVERCDRGRPRHVYSLTANGDGLFPDKSANFACCMLAQVEQSFGEGAVERLLAEQTDATITELERELDGLDFDARVVALAGRFDELGYVTEVKRLDDGSYRVVEHNCPTREVAGRFPQVCEQELRIYERLLGGRVFRDCTMAADGATCEYRILPEAAMPAVVQIKHRGGRRV